jgi:hypothetical protein
MPAQAGTQCQSEITTRSLVSRLRGNDGECSPQVLAVVDSEISCENRFVGTDLDG